MDDDLPTELLAGRFELGPALGRGGMATVHSAYDTRLGRTVAVKILHEGLSEADAARIEREARAAARISDARVVTVLDLDHTADGTPFLVFEALTGRTLADELLEHGAMAPIRIERLAADLLGALEAAHDCGVLHRDVKPSNILVDGPGFRITDFGIASVDDETATRGDLIGTLAYLAPERLDGATATARSDVFSAAVVLYEALTGQQPFRAPTAAETIERLRSGRYEPLSADTPDDVRGAIVAGLDPDPAQRPADAGAFASRIATRDVETPTAPIGAEATARLDLTEHLAPPAAATSTGTASEERIRLPQTVFIAVGALLLLLLLFAVTRDGDPGSEELPTTDDPAQQLDRQLDRIEELG